MIRKPWATGHGIPLDNFGPSMTSQSEADECEISNIVARFHRTGVLPNRESTGQYADVSGLNRPSTELIVDSMETMGKMKDAQIKREEQQELAITESEASQQEPTDPPNTGENENQGE